MKKYHLILLSLFSGALLTLSWPSDGFSFLALFGWIPVLFIDDYIRKHPEHFRRFSIFLYVLPGFVLWNVLTTYWLYNSTALGSLFVFVLNSVFMSLVVTIFHVAGRKLYSNYQGYLLLIMLWISFEFLHLHWDISFPWLNLGNVFSSTPWAVQWYEYTGIFGGSFYVLLTNIFLFLALKHYLISRKPNRPVLLNLGMAIILNAVLLLSSFFIYKNYEDQGAQQEVVIVQPNLDPYSEQYKLSPAKIASQIADMAEKKISPQTDIVAAPESALQESIWEENLERSPSIQVLKNFVNENPHLSVLVGASTFSRIEETNDLPLSARLHASGFYYNAHNTALLIDTTYRRQLYHKSKLVAGVEKMPFKRVLQYLPVEEFAIDLGGTIGTLGIDQKRKVLYSPDSALQIAPEICYESVYGEFTGKYIRNGANAIFIITNDGWWGNTAGHRQHLNFASLRAIETRKSIARSANTGISAFINQRGDILQATEYWEEDVIRGEIRTNDIKTFYAKNGDYIARISVFGAILLLLISIVASIVKKRKPV